MDLKRTDIEYIEIVKSLHDYQPTEPGCLSLKQGDLIYVIQKDSTGWWLGVVGKEKGWFPSNWIEALSEKVDDVEQLENAQSPTALEDKGKELPAFWRRKETPTGQVYYYNTQTNQTTYDYNQVLQVFLHNESSVKKRQSLLWKEDQVVANTEAKPLPIPQTTWIPGPRTLLKEGNEVTWELLINNILKSISDLNYSAKNDIKGLYIQQASTIVRAIRDMLNCSSTISSDSEIIKSNRSLGAYHANIMTSLSKIILAAKVASGLWPPPDAVHSMRFQAGQVLLAVRHFVAVAQDLGIQLKPLPSSDEEDEEFDIKGTELSDTELVSRLDQSVEVIMNSIASLVTKITRDRAFSQQLLENVKNAVTEIGQFMSLVEDIKIDPSITTNTEIIGEFKSKKEKLYEVVNELILSASNQGDSNGSYGNSSNALGMMLESATMVLEVVEEVLVASKLVIDHKELMLQKSLFNQNDTEVTELKSLQQRMQGLQFAETPASRTVSINSNVYGSDGTPSSARIVSGSQWNRDARSSSDSAPYGRKPSLSQQSFGRMSNEITSPAPDSAKLSQFFGDEVASARLSDQNLRPWYLRKEPTYEISYNMEGAVNGGTFPALVERLTVHDQPVDPGFANSFLMTFHLFGTAEQLFQTLVQRYTMEPPAGLSQEDVFIWTEKKLLPVQMRVCNALKSWLENYWIDRYDDVCLDDIHSFASNTMMQSQPQAAQRILELVSKRVATDVYGTQTTTPKMKRYVKPEDIQAPILPKSLKRFTLMDLDPLETARQLTILEMNIFLKIQPIELMKQEWSKKNTTSLAVNVRAMTAMSTKVTGWVICTILQEADVKRRANVLKYFIKVGERCLALNNFNTLIAIQSAFNSSTISRLKKTWELLSAKTKGTFEILKKATDHSRNYADYRLALKRVQLPALPFLGLFLTDLTFTDDGNPDTRNNGKLINFDKYSKTAKIISDLVRYQNPYPLTEIPEIQDYLNQSIQDRGTRDAQDLYELSLRLEPRDDRGVSAGPDGPEEVNRELEAKIMMLQKAGML